MTNSTTLKYKEQLMEAYVESHEGDDIFDYDNVGFEENPHVEVSLKSEFDLSDDEMAVELGYTSFNDYAHQMYLADTVENFVSDSGLSSDQAYLLQSLIEYAKSVAERRLMEQNKTYPSATNWSLV